jgi:hypothetical protein
MIKAECDRCGRQAEVNGSVIAVPGVAFMREPALPENWRRVTFPAVVEGEKDQRKHLCGRCVNALLLFLVDDGAVPGLLEDEGSGRVTVRLEETGVAGAEYRVAAIEGCTCPQPVEPTPPCPLHRPVCEVTGNHTAAPGEGGVCQHCGAVYDERPNLTERARKLAAGERAKCTCAGVGFGTEDCVAHHPEGLAKGTHLKCYQDPEGKECPGIYRRGMFREHMQRWHGVPVAEGSKPCPFCATIEPGIMRLGQHIAKEHPGDWQAWCDGGSVTG